MLSIKLLWFPDMAFGKSVAKSQLVKKFRIHLISLFQIGKHDKQQSQPRKH